MFKSVSPQVNFPQLEKKLLDSWYKKGIVKKYLHRNDNSKKKFSFLDGPITANNPMGVHHAWGRTNKDLWQRFHNMLGDKQRFQNGFDCQGLWIEVEVEKELGIRNKKDIENLIPGDKKASIAKFVQLCKDRVMKFSTIQTEQNKRLGYFMNWDNSYYTLSDENNYMIWHFLKTCHQKGWIYKGRAVVPWCSRCETAISQHEILTEDYKEVTHETVYLKFPILDKNNEYLLVWTTTPWTVPANIAVAVDEELNYSLVKVNSDKYWITVARIKEVITNKDKQILKTVKGKELVGLKYQAPYDHLPAVKKAQKDNPKLFHMVIATDPLLMPINTNEGTGLVHTSPSTGEEDFQLGEKLGLPMVNPIISDNADYMEGMGDLTGKNAKRHPEIILDFLKEKGNSQYLLITQPITHRYPRCWRCKTELVWKVADEWYIAMDLPEDRGQRTEDRKKGKTLRQMMMDVARKISWIPDFGLGRELDWLKNMHNWLISKKNRYWGLALPIYECDKCGNFEVIGSKEELKNREVSGWSAFDGKSPHKPYIDEVKIKCPKCSAIVSRIDDVGNVWLDAGIVPYSTYIDPKTRKLSYTTDKKYWQEWFPADLITESFPGQFKNWFYSMIAESTVLERKNPYKTVIGYASVLGEDGRPMHKSWGNSIEFNEAADKIGVDVMRWMYVTHHITDNLLFGYKTADETRRKFHLLLWNVYNFFITYANVDKFQIPDTKYQIPQNVLDTWILSRLNHLINIVTDHLAKYDAATASQGIEFFVTELSQWYVRRSRDRVGPTVPDGTDKNYCHSTLYEVLITISKLLAPFNPFISDEIYQNLTAEESVHLASWPVAYKNLLDNNLEKDMLVVRKIVELGHAQRKTEGFKVRQPLWSLLYKSPKKLSADLEKLIADELNIKNISWEKGGSISTNINFDIDTHPELKKEGQARDLIREIQIKRKELGCTLIEKIIVTLPDYPVEFANLIKKETLAANLNKGPSLTIQRT